MAGLIISDVDLKLFTSTLPQIFLLQVWCPVVLYHQDTVSKVLSNFGLQETLSCKVLQKCATLHVHKHQTKKFFFLNQTLLYWAC